jgi:hypothetical protein
MAAAPTKFRARDVFQTRPPAEVEPPAAEPEASPDEGTGEPPAAGRKKFWQQGQGDKIKSDVGGDAKKYAGKLGKLAHVSDPAGAMAGVLAYALIINGIRYGTPGITGWLKAKFLNEPMQGQAVNALAPTTSGGTLSV